MFTTREKKTRLSSLLLYIQNYFLSSFQSVELEISTTEEYVLTTLVPINFNISTTSLLNALKLLPLNYVGLGPK